MRHLLSLLAGLVVAPLVVVLASPGMTVFLTFDGNPWLGLAYLAGAGLVAGAIATPRISPVGPIVAGAILVGLEVYQIVRPGELTRLLRLNDLVVGGLPFRLLSVESGLCGVVGALLLVAAASPQRWRRRAATASAVPGAQGFGPAPEGPGPYGAPAGAPVPPGAPVPAGALVPAGAPGQFSVPGPYGGPGQAPGEPGQPQWMAPYAPTQPISGPPVSASPVSGSPVSGSPVSGAPGSGAPISGAPASGAPMSGSPGWGAPVSGSPGWGAPVSGGPVSGPPVPAAAPGAGPAYPAATSPF